MTGVSVLRRLAKAATPGPWDVRAVPARMTVAQDTFGRFSVQTPDGGYPGAELSGIRSERDARFIAAADPTTILAILDDRDELIRLLRRTYQLVPYDRLDLVDDEVDTVLASARKSKGHR